MDSANHTYQFIAGNLALDFVNTVAYRANPAKRADRLQRAEDVSRWASQARLPELAAMKSGPRVGASGLGRIRTVREHLFEIFGAVAGGDPIPPEALVRVGDAFNECCAKRRLSVDQDVVRWTWRANARSADYLLHPILSAAIELLTSDSLGSVRLCEDATCGWLFLDRSNARKRRWCSMADCGNRNKVRNYYKREAGLS